MDPQVETFFHGRISARLTSDCTQALQGDNDDPRGTETVQELL